MTNPIKIEIDTAHFGKEFDQQTKEIADKVREAAGISLRYGHNSIAQYLDQLADEIESPVEVPTFKELIGVRP